MNSFSSISENKFVGASDGKIVSWCPTMDLLTISMNRTSLWIFRVNGERVYSINNKSIITDISWKPDGQSFALMGIDGICKIYDSNSGKLIHEIKNTVAGKINITQAINWSERMSESIGGMSQSNKHVGGGFFGIFDIDIATQLPSLPASITQSTYTSRVMVDDMNNTCSDFLVIVDAFKSASVTFHNLFTIDSIELPKNGIKKYLKLATYSLDKQFFLVKSNDDSIGLIEMKLNLESKFQPYLTEVTSQCSRILSLLGYIEEVFATFLNNDLSPFLDSLDRYFSNYKDALYEGSASAVDFPTTQEANEKMSFSLYDILVTNLIESNQKDFWLNQFGERGIKRLHSLGNTAYDSIRKVCFSQLMSALERLVVVLTRLQGLSKWLDSENKSEKNDLGLSTDTLSSAITLAGELMKNIYKFIWEINEEQKLFNYFIDWITRVIVERLIKEDDIIEEENMNDKFLVLNGYKNSDIMKYIDNYLFSSKILKYVQLNKDYECIIGPAPSHESLFEQFKSFQNKLNEEFLVEVRNIMKSHITFSSQFALSINDEERSTLKIIQEFGYISCISGPNILKIIQFEATNPETTLKDLSIEFEASVSLVKVDILASDEIVVLSKMTGTHTLSSISLSTLFTSEIAMNSWSVSATDLVPLKSRIFNSNEFIPSYVSINERIGCLLDENKQNYKIISNE
ncbi:hypothetical protein CLIB1423_24S01442 [[Candida] railenensis]|uniref:Anaphase-promoting complex subunit 4 n=1 Tax=[Candida] railenensis TaxID=45579 RepID=A0A9P0QVD5_9ASCO|nr:hypothetical protein CLIB1423_24S01442 [[Candida] railenensis]